LENAAAWEYQSVASLYRCINLFEIATIDYRKTVKSVCLFGSTAHDGDVVTGIA